MRKGLKTHPTPLVQNAFLFALTIGMAACGTLHSKPSDSSAGGAGGTNEEFLPRFSQAAGVDSSIEISYLLGRNLHELSARLTPEIPAYAVGQAFSEHELVKIASIDLGKYVDLLSRAADLMRKSAQSRTPANNAPCRSPFSITLRVEEQSRSLIGCRSGEEGIALSRLARDAEFLLYSRGTLSASSAACDPAKK